MSIARILLILGSIAMIIGAIDPLEGSVVILVGSAMLLISAFLEKSELRYWIWVFILIAVGVGAMWWLSALGGIGNSTGRSMWWGIIILPYPIGWLLGLAGLIRKLIQFLGARGEAAKS